MIKVLQVNCREYYTICHLIAEVLCVEDSNLVLLNNNGVLPPKCNIKHYAYTTRITQIYAPRDGVAVLLKAHIRHDYLTTRLSPHFLAGRIHTLRVNIIIVGKYTRPNAGLRYTDINTLLTITASPPT